VPHAIVGGVVGMMDDLGRNRESRYVSTGLKQCPVLPEVGRACDMLFEAIRPTVEATEPGPVPERP
jgi:hypothetical protein